MFRIALHWQILIGMTLGAAIGITFNRTSGERTVTIDETDLPKGVPPKAQRPKTVLPEGVSKLMIRDTPDRIDIEITDDKGLTRLAVVDATDDKAYPTTGELKSKDAQAYELLHEHGRSTSRWIGDTSQSIGGLFLRMLRMVAVPLIVASLITGIMSLGRADRLGKMFGRTLLYYVCTSTLAIMPA